MKQPMQVMFLTATTAMIVTAIGLGTTSAKEGAEPPSTEPPGAAADSLVISAAKPLPAKETKLRQEVYNRCKDMLDAPAGKFGAHPAAAVFPGPVVKDTPRIARTVPLKHVPPSSEMLRLIKPLDYSSPFRPTMYSVGLYAAPGEVVTVDIPKELAGKLEVQIGCHTDNLNEWMAAKEDWRRMPLLTNSHKLEMERTQIANPFGGLIYITCPPTAEAWQTDISISNAVMSPLFVLGQTTDAQWQQMTESTGAPWGELATENVIITLPVAVLKQISDPAQRMQLWDRIVGATMDLAQLPMPFYRAQRLVTDIHIGGGFMHSGYPIMVHHCPEVGLVTEDFIANPEKFSQPANGGPNWGFFHEIGHNMQNLDWVFNGTTEVSVNLFSLYCFDKVCGGRDAAHPGVSNETSQKMLKDYFSKPADFRQWQSDPFLGLLTFRMIQNDFGWDLFKRTFQRYHTLADAERPQNDQQKRERLVQYLSESAGRNFEPYFSAWGIPISRKLREDLKKYPTWIPYNFPTAPAKTGSWDNASLGNHRAVLKVAAKADVVRVRIPWHRRDADPEKKNIIVIEESTGRKVTNRLPIEVQGDYGEILLQADNPGIYHVYYMPYVCKESSYPKATYPALENTADPAWLANYGLKFNAPNAILPENFPQATFVEIQSIDEFSSYTPMELAAAPEEENKLAAAHPDKPFLLFPEDRANPIRMTDHLPQKWLAEGPRLELAGEAARGEFYAFQLGLYAVAADIPDITVSFSDLQTSDGSRVIPSSALRCINTGGTNWDGVAFRKPLRVQKGRVQALWCGVQIPKDLGQGNYQGQVRVKPDGMPEQSVGLALTVVRKRLANSGDNEPWRHSRLRWLDSTLALDDEIVQPFLPIQVKQDTLEILGRRLELAPSGLPSQVLSYFSPEVTKIQETAKPLLAAPLELLVEDSAGQNMQWSPGEIHFTKKQDGIVQWNTTRTAGSLRMDLEGTLEFEGFTQFKVTISSTEPVAVRDIRLEMPLVKEAVKYMMGLGLKGGIRPASCEWVWGVKKNQDGAWLGDANAGLQFKLKGENFSRPLLTNFYADKPLNMPHSWSNDDKGGISIRESQESAVVVRCYGGARTLTPGENLHFDFDLLLTPFKPLDTKGQWSTRYFHSYQPVDEVLQTGANTVNIHHGNEANPYINYPFIHVAEMKDYIEEAHAKGLKVKIYYTIRELSNHANELFALRSLGDEIFPTGPGGGHSWLQEHLGSNYLPAWCVPQWQDAAIINNGMSRWNNYYIEGLDWLVKNVVIDGLYLDDLGFDRTTMKRIRKVLDRGRPGSLIDFHSANLYNPKDGFGNCANIYLEHLPYINRLWFGEYFDHDAPPDFWLTELSGIPYGVMGEMLQDGGNKWRGMIYGMTNRIPYQGNDPSPIWKVWDEVKIQESAMIGYWSSRCPVKTDHKDVLATAYVGHEKSLIALASWAAEDVNVRLSIDWRALGIDPAKAKIIAPEIRDYQAAAQFNPDDSIPVPQGKGWLLVVTPG